MSVQFWGWCDGDRKKPATEKLADAIRAYQRHFGSDPAVCLTSYADAEQIGEGGAIPVRPCHFLSGGSFLVGVEDQAA
jgi:hypothetical protein